MHPLEIIYNISILASVIYVSIVVGFRLKRDGTKAGPTIDQIKNSRTHYIVFIFLFLAIAFLAAAIQKPLFSFIWLGNSIMWFLSYKKTQKHIRIMEGLEHLKNNLSTMNEEELDKYFDEINKALKS